MNSSNSEPTYVNRYWTIPENILKTQIKERDEIIAAYQKHLAYLLAQTWYAEHLPEIRRYYESLTNNQN